MHFIYKTPDAIICITINIQEKYKKKTQLESYFIMTVFRTA